MRFPRAIIALAVSGCAHAPTDHGATADSSTSDGAPLDAATATDGMLAADAFSPTTWKPAGKGLWIWYFDYTGLTAHLCERWRLRDELGLRFWPRQRRPGFTL